jgi:hypothetical protein
MKFCRSVSTALGIVLAVAAMPASAGWKNFFVDSNPAPSSGAPHVPEDDPIDLPDALTQALTSPDLGNEPPAFDPPVLTSTQLNLANEGPQTAQVPEPGIIFLLALALLAMGWSCAYRKQSKESADR